MADMKQLPDGRWVVSEPGPILTESRWEVLVGLVRALKRRLRPYREGRDG